MGAVVSARPAPLKSAGNESKTGVKAAATNLVVGNISGGGYIGRFNLDRQSFAPRDLAYKSETDRYIIVVAIIGKCLDPYSQNRNPQPRCH